MGNISSKFDWNSCLENPGNFTSILRVFKLVLKKVVSKIVNETKAQGFEPNKKTTANPPYPAGNTSTDELLSNSDTRELLSEVLNSLDLIDHYLQRPSEETADPLRSLLNRESDYNEYLTTDKVDEVLELLRKIESLKVKEMEEENQEILSVLGELLFEKMSKENEERKSEDFQRIFRSSLHEAQTTNGPSPANTPVAYTATPGQHPVRGAEAFVEEENDKSEFHGGNYQSSTRQSYENSSSPIQQDDPSAREHVTLSTIPLTPVGTTIYNNYKLLLLAQVETLSSSEVGKLKIWANQDFSIENAQNATDVLFQLDEKGVINASDLSQLRTFFESIGRFDLVHTIDVFLLGEYSSLHELLTSLRTMARISTTRTNPTVRNNARNGSNGLKHSTLRHSDEQQEKGHILSSKRSQSQTLDQGRGDLRWLCSHYKRHCYVKFECCNKFWPCHRCHNEQSTCGRRRLKPTATKMVKCVYCKKVQQFGQSCCNCRAQFATYYCGICKHLTGEDDHPYHCEKCGICRIHADRSFHCDICGICLDLKLRNNHKCREGSAHDECCICLEDAFTGCQILPCSHKVHKECATEMIRSGITRCPICHESFAHKLERRPRPNPRKHSGK